MEVEVPKLVLISDDTSEESEKEVETVKNKNNSSKKYCEISMDSRNGRELIEMNLRDFLTAARVRIGNNNSEPFTHTSLGPKESYFIDGDNEGEFFDLYKRALVDGVKLCITEKPEYNCPLHVDLDMKAEISVGLKRQWKWTHVIKLIKIYQEEIKAAVKEEEFEESLLVCIVLIKSKPRIDKDYIKDGMHLHFPFFICDRDFQDEYLRNRVLERMKNEKVWHGTNYSCTKMASTCPEDEFIDKIGKNQWLMYGSAKDINAEPFLYAKAFNAATEEITLDKIFEQEMCNREEDVMYHLPEFLSIRGCNTRATPLKYSVELARGNVITKKKRKTAMPQGRSMEKIAAELQLIKEAEFMNMIADWRAEEYNQWYEIGHTLFCISSGGDDELVDMAKNMWIEFSRRSESNFDEHECEKKWKNMTTGSYTIGTLKWLAKKDSPQRYEQWRMMDIDVGIKESVREAKPSNHDIAKFISVVYQNKFKCTIVEKKRTWYCFEDHRWKVMNGENTLRKIMTMEVVNQYYRYAADLAKRQLQADENERERLKKEQERCAAVITALKDINFEDKVIRQLEKYWVDDKFEKIKDDNKLLWGCENGVLDLENGVFREGRPDDNITMSCELHYQDYCDTDPEIEQLHDFFRKVFPDESKRNFFLDTAASCLRGGNTNKLFLVNTGQSDGGKSTTFALLARTFGQYNCNFPPELFIEGRGNASGAARPEIMQARGKRLGVVSEIPRTAKFNIGMIRWFTGNDQIVGRGLYKDTESFQPQFTLMAQCNECPNVPGQDEAVWERIRVVDFESKFVKIRRLAEFPVPKTEAEQFRMKRFHADLNFMKKLPDLAPAFLWMLFKRFASVKDGMKEPESVMASTKMYNTKNDVYIQFMGDKLERIIYEELTEDVPFLTLPEAYAEFISWYKENFQSYKNTTSRIDFRDELSKKLYGECTKKGRTLGWYGYRIRTDDREADKEDELKKIINKK
jgi:P4 family phage/plasmid primase-like protien